VPVMVFCNQATTQGILKAVFKYDNFVLLFREAFKPEIVIGTITILPEVPTFCTEQALKQSGFLI
jgi:hypothetical protein